jgi:methyl-accepting chemotaxis protein
MRIRTKVIGLAAVPCLALLAISGFGWHSLTASRSVAMAALHDEIQIASRIEQFNDSITLLLNADRDAHQALIAEKLAIYAATPEALRQGESDNADNLKQVIERAELASGVFDAEMSEIYAKFRRDFAAWEEQTQNNVRAAKAGAPRESLEEQHAKSVAMFDTMRKHIDDMQNLEDAQIGALRAHAEEKRDVATAEVNGTIQAASMMFLGLGGGALIVTGVMAFAICRSVFGRLGFLLGRMTEVAQGDGDLTVRINDASRDECGMLAQQFDNFVSRVQEIMKSVSESSHSVASAATQIAASNEEMSAGLAEQADQVSQVSAATEEMSATSQEVANKSTEGKGVVEETVRRIEEIAGEVKASAAAVNTLGQKSEEIGQIIAVINDIADQTNLLALNAAIEAARAGEHGRGFAVVADEVRKLAERTTQATEQVGSSIREIQSETEGAVRRMEAGTQKVQGGVEFARQAGDALGSIVAAAEQQSAATIEISQSVEQINSVAMQSKEGAQQAAAAAAQLSAEAEKLQALVKRFKL